MWAMESFWKETACMEALGAMKTTIASKGNHSTTDDRLLSIVVFFTLAFLLKKKLTTNFIPNKAHCH